MPFVTGINRSLLSAGTANKIGFRPRSGVTTSRMNKFIHFGPTPYPFLSMIFPLSSCPFSIHAGMSLLPVHLLRRDSGGRRLKRNLKNGKYAGSRL